MVNVKVKDVYRRLKGTPITARQMHNLNTPVGDVKVFAGGATEANIKESSIENINIINQPIVIVQSRGIIDFIYYDKKCTFKNEMWAYTADNIYTVKFLYYYLKYNVDHFQNAGSGRSSFPQISLSDTDDYEIPFLSETEQEEIVKVISSFEECISNLTELIEKKKNIREGALEDLINQKIRLGGFEEPWIKVDFNQVIVPKARIGWQGLKKQEYLMDGYSYLIGGTDFYHGKISLDKIQYVSEEWYNKDKNIQVSEGDVLVTKDGTIGKVAIVSTLSKPATLNSGVFVFRTSSKLLPNFLYFVLISSVFKKFIESLAAGSTIKHLYQKDLKNFEFYIPSDIKEQKEIALILTSMDEEIETLEVEKDKMIQIKEGLMNDLLTGRVHLTI